MTIDPEKPLSMTGSDVGAPATHDHAVCVALGRLREGVRVGCWLVGAALLVQLAVWMLVNLTDLRWVSVDAAAVPLVVVAAEPDVAVPPSALDDPAPPPAVVEPVNPNRVKSSYDRVFSITAGLAGGVGRLGVLVLAPWIGLGVLLAASSATRGVDRIVSGFGWSLTAGLLLLPIGALLGLPWDDGGFWTYETMVHEVDVSAAASGLGPLLTSEWPFFAARYLLLPAVCGIGIAIAGLRFDSGVRAGLLRREQIELDPALENEAGNIKSTSLHGVRNGAALSNAMGDDDNLQRRALPAGTGEPSPPRRLI